MVSTSSARLAVLDRGTGYRTNLWALRFLTSGRGETNASCLSGMIVLNSTAARKAQISITGTLGSGKSTVASLVAKSLGWHHFSTGAAQREIAQSMGMSTLELNRAAETDKTIDEKIDSIFRELGGAEGVVADSRMAWHFMPESFRVRLIVAPEVAAHRIIADSQRDAEKYQDTKIAVADIVARADSERKRFKHTYNVDITSDANYDTTIDTLNVRAQDVAELVLANYFLWRQKAPFANWLISPKTLIPTQSIRRRDEGGVSGNSPPAVGDATVAKPDPLVLLHRDYYFIVDGHHRVCKAARLGSTAIPVKIVRSLASAKPLSVTEERFILDSVKRSAISDWEDACAFQFEHLPDWLPS